ncbi:BCCT family transporter [Desulfohalovibrio reitneri]|uniref:BCCT family transporter n=1 Tax=Desulfohalovibrio reitneri TaxID=1307759 RepID=UPI0009DFE2AC|nr:BCCT family transporter [Desulfohalovibrio reitneri]
MSQENEPGGVTENGEPQEQPEPSYEEKAIQIAQEHWERQERKAIKERRMFRGLQIVPTSSFYDESHGHKPGESNWMGYGFDLHPQVTVVAGVLLLAFISLTLYFGPQAEAFFQNLLDSIGNIFGWFYIFSANVFVLIMFILAASRFGGLRIGGPDALPEFSTFSWYAMLISAGMGIGLLFWSVAEPIFHYSNPSPMFDVAPNTPQAAQVAMGQTYFHWGLHPWGIYALVGLSLAFFAYNRGLPLTIRSIFHPLLGDRIYGFWGNLIDILSVLATLFGLATSLGLGVTQVASGLNFLFGLPSTTNSAVLLIAIITGFATLSVIAGLDKGVKLLSSINLYLAAAFLLFLLAAGPTVYVLQAFTQNIGFYIQNLPRLSFWVETFYGSMGSSWQTPWTLFYWGWWISWSPFVGMFIARVSKGRTVREFILGVMIIPSLLSFLWMSTFGGSALWLESTGVADIAAAVEADVSTALFAMLENFPLARVSSFIGVVLVTVFFVTSSDSGSLVVDHLTSGGKLDSPVPQRVFWAIMEGLCAAVLLLGGGLVALQSASIATGLPFTLVLLVMCYSLYKGLQEEHFHAQLIETMRPEVRRFEIPVLPTDNPEEILKEAKKGHGEKVRSSEGKGAAEKKGGS